MFTRRGALGLLGSGALVWSITPARAQAVFSGPAQTSGALQAAIDTASAAGQGLMLPAGRYPASGLRIPAGFVLSGIPGASVLVQTGRDALLTIDGADGVTLEGLTFHGGGTGGDIANGGLINIGSAQGVTVRDCWIDNTAMNGIAIYRAGVLVDNCTITRCEHAGIFAFDSLGVIARANRVSDCGNGGIRIFRGTRGPDGSIITGNRISDIDWRGGGNGQNGNGINIFRADEVIVADNHIRNCTFTAVRLNTTENTQVRGNMCINSGEVAIFSEFTFASSVIADNIVDGAAAGISMTNYNEGGRLAVCSGNIVRNLYPNSAVNPDTFPYGIAAEADAVVTGNLVEPGNGIGILMGWGPFLREVAVSGNTVRDAEAGIVVTVAPGAGAGSIVNNMISGARQHAIAASAWWDVQSGDLVADAARYPQLTVSGNTILNGR